MICYLTNVTKREAADENPLSDAIDVDQKSFS